MACPHSKSTENTVFVRFNPPSPDITRFHLQDYFSQIGPIRKCSVIRSPSTNKGMGYGFVKFVSKQDADKAASTENGKLIVIDEKQYKLTVELAASTAQPNNDNKSKETNNKDPPKDTPVQQTTPPDTTTLQDKNDVLLAKRKRTSRVIVRNVSFYAKERDIQRVLQKEYGPIVELTLPKVNDKLHRGFCFVTFAKESDAQRAVQPRNTFPLLIKKRPVAIDFAVSKQIHQQVQRQQNEKVSKTKGAEEKDESESSSSHDEKDDSSTSDDDSSNNDEQAENASDEVKNEADKDSDSDDDDDVSSNSKEENDDDDDESSDASDDKDMEVDDQSHVPAPPDHDDAIDDHRSLFVRNLPFDATRHDLFELFSPFGYIESIHLVKDKNTGVAKGTAFLAFRKTQAAQKALGAAAGSSEFVTQREGSLTVGQHSGLHLRGRRLFVDLAVDKKTAASLTVEKQGNKVTGRDRRNLYLKMEGRVANESDGNISNNAWENLPESDQLKRQRAFAEKNTKLRSPLFFINSKRLSVRNLAKHVDEAMLKKLCVQATRRGIDTNLVTQEDQVAHWRASGDFTTRDIMKRIEQAKEETGSVIPPFDEKNVKRYIPSVFIGRDFTTNKKEKAPSRGYGFVDFEHHAHALACLRELNNNPYYSAEFVMGGKKAVEAKKQARKRKKTESPKGEFVGEDGRALTPRLIVDFTVENKAKAKKQAEHRAIQQANVEKQRLEMKEKKLVEQKERKQQKKKRSRGAIQREKKRKAKEGAFENGEIHGESNVMAKAERMESSKIAIQSETRQTAKPIKPPKKKHKVDVEEQNFENLVDTYRKAFSGESEQMDDSVVASTTSFLAKKAEKRWFE